MRYLRKVTSVLLPWQSRHQRQEAISDARREKERSQSGARHAAAIQRDIERMAAVNHFADAIRASLIQGRQGHRNGG